MKNIRLLITDLDDTIWDWLSMWYNSFSPYFESIKDVTKVNEKELIESFKKIHQKYHSSEFSFAFRELDCLTNDDKKDIEQKIYQNNRSIIHNYYHNKKHNLKFYSNVLSTLIKIKKQGALIVGFTESNSFFTKYRIKTLDIDGLFDSIYSPKDIGIPRTTKLFYEKGKWDLKHTEINILPEKTKKPNPKILLKIVEDYGVRLDEIIYIGDKLEKDIYMAKTANITSVHALYGNKVDSKQYSLLRKVTHWTKEDVEREIQFNKDINKKEIQPDYIINDFEELLTHFNFINYKQYSEEDKKNLLTIWANIVSVQKHFNDIEIRIRNCAITLYTFF